MALSIDIVFLLEDLRPGGVQRQALEVAKRLNRMRFSPSIWTLAGPAELDQAAKDANIVVNNLGLMPSPGVSFPFVLFKKLLGSAPDVLLPCGNLANIWGRMLGWLTRVPVIVGTCRDVVSIGRQNEHLLWRAADHLICNSMPLYNGLCNIGIPSGRVTYIANGVDAGFFEPPLQPMTEREPIILSVGRLVTDKDQMTLLRAFARVLETYPTAKLRIVGDGPQEFTLRRVIEGMPYRGRVHIIGSGTDMLTHYQTARIFALSSIREGLPDVVLEAMASGLPVVCTNVGGLPSLVNHTVTGLLSPGSDAVTLGNNLCQLLNDPLLCQRMGEAGRERAVNEFAFEATAKNHEKLLERLWDLRQGNTSFAAKDNNNSEQ